MKYSILKDDKVENTINKISNILINKLKLKIEETYMPEKPKKNIPVTVRLNLNNSFEIGSNGKGTCINNARASAYAEFMERLENLVLFPSTNLSEYYAPDKILIDKKISYNNKFLDSYFSEKFDLLFKTTITQKGDIGLPYYSIKENKVYYLPYNITSFQKGTNGMAAGNSIEEAIVQGLSELCERYVQKIVFTKRVKMPDISQNQYLKYDEIKKLIKYLNNTGKCRVGYNIKELRLSIEKTLGFSKPKDVFIIGAGNLGSALAKYDSFSNYGLNILAMFDIDPIKIGITINNR